MTNNKSNVTYAGAKRGQLPPGYEVKREFGTDLWKWESILAPECHSKGGYATESEAIIGCVAAQGD